MNVSTTDGWKLLRGKCFFIALLGAFLPIFFVQDVFCTPLKMGKGLVVGAFPSTMEVRERERFFHDIRKYFGKQGALVDQDTLNPEGDLVLILGQQLKEEYEEAEKKYYSFGYGDVLQLLSGRLDEPSLLLMAKSWLALEKPTEAKNSMAQLLTVNPSLKVGVKEHGPRFVKLYQELLQKQQWEKTEFQEIHPTLLLGRIDEDRWKERFVRLKKSGNWTWLLVFQVSSVGWNRQIGTLFLSGKEIQQVTVEYMGESFLPEAIRALSKRLFVVDTK